MDFMDFVDSKKQKNSGFDFNYSVYISFTFSDIEGAKSNGSMELPLHCERCELANNIIAFVKNFSFLHYFSVDLVIDENKGKEVNFELCGYIDCKDRENIIG